MKTKYKYIHFQISIEDRDIWECYNSKHGDLLGDVFFFERWNQYVFAADNAEIIFSAECLNDIKHFLEQLNEKAST